MFNFLKTNHLPVKEVNWFKAFGPKPRTEVFSPDFTLLQGGGREWCLVFLYDELMQDRRRYPKIKEDSINLARAFTADREFALWKKKVGSESFPIPLEGADKISKVRLTSRPIYKMKPEELEAGILGRIKGELHAVRPWVMEDLDKHYLNGIEFQRRRVRVLLPYHIQQGSVTIDYNEFVTVIRCWMWVGIKSHWIKQLDGGFLFQPVGAFKPGIKWSDGHDIGIYYCYTRLEDATNF